MYHFQRIIAILTRYPDKPITDEVLEQITYFIDGTLLKLIYNIVVSLTQWVQRFILTTPTGYLGTEAFNGIYFKMTLLALTILAIDFLIIGLLKTMGKNIDVESVAKKVLGFPFIVILAPYVIIRVVDLFNFVSKTIINTDAMIIPERSTIGTIIGTLLFMIIFSILMIRVIWFYAKRFVKLLLFAVLFPVIYSLWCIPTYERVLNKWKDDLLSLLFAQVIHALILLILGSLVIGASQTGSIVFTLLIQCGALGVMGEVEKTVGGYFGSTEQLMPRNVKEGQNRLEKYSKRYVKGKEISKSVLNNTRFLRRFLK